MTASLGDLRRQYATATLDRSSLDDDPGAQFRRWFADAERAQLLEPNAMTLATADATGRPSARIVLLKGVDARGFVFFTDYRSRKARELAANPRAALAFLWKELERQVRVTGGIELVTPEESASYFRTRPRGSRLGAWASLQSAELPDRAMLEREVARLDTQYPGDDIPLPPHWGGYRLLPDEFEFWQGRENRLHDRFRYLRNGQQWKIDRLSP
ncbi:MAG TPA: pyridoxamine 5'-phosphate oxidase [Gemmatimonadaceae bacterium]|jgi:pyridoxamine 5'-phosphate oxidase